MMTQKHWDLMVRFVANEATAKERQELDEWLRAYPQYRQVLQEMQVIWEARGSSVPEFESSSAFANLRARLHRGSKNNLIL